MNEGTTDRTSLLLLGVGGIGCELAAKCPAPRRLLDFDAQALARYEAGETLSLLGDADNTDDMSPDAMHRAAEEAAAGLVAAAEGRYSIVVTIGAVGGQTGAIVLPTLARELKDADVRTVVVAVEPFPFEGAARGEMAARALGELEQAADLLLTVPNRPLHEVCDASLPVNEALECLKDKTAAAIGQLLDVLADGSCVGLHPAQMRQTVADAGRGAFGVGTGRGEQRIEDAVRDACAHSFLTRESCQQASAAILNVRGGPSLSLQEVHGATELVAHLVGQAPVQVGLSTSGGDSNAVRATLIVTGIRPPQPQDDPLAPLGQSEDLSVYEGVNLDIPAFLRRKSSYHLTR
ncbi:MAG: hypothetical protein ACOC8D_00200 [bacterium]